MKLILLKYLQFVLKYRTLNYFDLKNTSTSQVKVEYGENNQLNIQLKGHWLLYTGKNYVSICLLFVDERVVRTPF